MGACGCPCECHASEGPDWPGPCAACCEPGDRCACGQALWNESRPIEPTRFTDPAYRDPYNLEM